MAHRPQSQVKPAHTLRWHSDQSTFDLCRVGTQLAQLADKVAQHVAGQVNEAFQANDQRRVNLAVGLDVDGWSSTKMVMLENVKVSESGLPDVTDWVCALSGFDRTAAYIGLGAQALDAGKIGTHTVTLSVEVEVCS